MHKIKVLASLIGLIACASTLLARPAAADPPVGKGYKLLFSDDFNGTSLDTTKWSYNYPWSTYHNGMANMQPSQVSVGGGLLTLKAEAFRSIWEPWGIWRSDFNKYVSFDYTSGAIHTNGKFRVQRGYIGGRFKMPPQLSTWPAFWTLQDGWPPELDILEVVGDRSRYYYNFHYTNTSGGHASFGGEKWGPNLSAAFHNYGVEWTETQLNFYFDNVLVRSVTNPTAVQQAQAMYLIINLQVGGWAPDPDPAQYPALYQCDWVRVWQVGGPENGTYRLTPKHAQDKALEVAGWNTNNGATIDLTTYGSGGANAQIRLERQTDGSYKIRPGMTYTPRLFYMKDWVSGNVGEGAAVTLWDDNGSSQQRWYFDEVIPGWWRVSSKLAPTKVLDAAGSTNGSLIKTYGYWGGDNQLWRLDAP